MERYKMHKITHQMTYEYYEPTEKQKEQMVSLRAAARAYSDILEKEIPEGPDKTFIIRQFRTVAMWVNVAVTRQPDGTPRE